MQVEYSCSYCCVFALLSLSDASDLYMLYKGRYRQRAKYQSGCKVRNLLLWDRSTQYFEQRNLMLLLTTLNSPFINIRHVSRIGTCYEHVVLSCAIKSFYLKNHKIKLALVTGTSYGREIIVASYNCVRDLRTTFGDADAQQEQCS